MLNGFDIIAPIYDQLAKFVFGKSIQFSQKCFLFEIKDCSTILILGGGTGWLLQELLRINGTGKICYIEASSKMIELTKVAVKNDARVTFVHGTEDDIPPLAKFDAVITNFYLDLFTEKSLSIAVRKIGKSVMPGAYWLATDFTSGTKWWQRLLLKVMYYFFRIVSKIESSELPDWRSEIDKAGFKEQRTGIFYSGFILSILYKLPH